MQARSLVAATLLEDVAEIQPAATVDVLDRVACPWTMVLNALLVGQVGHFVQRVLG